jgi:hypothetical protein
MRRALLLLSALVAPSIAAAQAHPLVGTWNVTIPVGMKVEGGESTPLTSSGTMAVTAQGDSLIAVLDLEAPEGMPKSPPRRIAGVRTAGTVTLTYTAEAKMYTTDGTVETHKAVSRFAFTVSGDVLSGTVAREIEGLPNMGPQPVTGTRAQR